VWRVVSTGGLVIGVNLGANTCGRVLFIIMDFSWVIVSPSILFAVCNDTLPGTGERGLGSHDAERRCLARKRLRLPKLDHRVRIMVGVG
jgi:hypothetical protein